MCACGRALVCMCSVTTEMFFGSGKKHVKQQYLVFSLVLSPHYSEQTLLLPCAFVVVSCLVTAQSPLQKIHFIAEDTFYIYEL